MTHLNVRFVNTTVPLEQMLVFNQMCVAVVMIYRKTL